MPTTVTVINNEEDKRMPRLVVFEKDRKIRIQPGLEAHFEMTPADELQFGLEPADPENPYLPEVSITVKYEGGEAVPLVLTGHGSVAEGSPERKDVIQPGQEGLAAIYPGRRARLTLEAGQFITRLPTAPAGVL